MVSKVVGGLRYSHVIGNRLRTSEEACAHHSRRGRRDHTPRKFSTLR